MEDDGRDEGGKRVLDLHLAIWAVLLPSGIDLLIGGSQWCTKRPPGLLVEKE